VILSFSSNHDGHDGYGYSTSLKNIRKSFSNFKYNNEQLTVVSNNNKPIIQVHYEIDPFHISFLNHHYRIHFSHFESTMAPKNKVDYYKQNSDEIWTSSPWSKQALVNAGIDSEKIHIHELGVDPNKFTKSLRGNKDKIRFLFMGDAVGNRKRPDLAISAFKKTFGNDSNYELTLKMGFGSIKTNNNWNSEDILKTGGNWIDTNIRYVNENVTTEEINSIINFHDIFVFPSEAEGFGLTPLECLATGMPTISTWEWASYHRYLLDNKIQSSIGPSNSEWGYSKLGNALNPNIDSIVDLMRYNANNIKIQSKIFYDQVDAILNDYLYDNISNRFLTNMISRLGTEIFREVI
jgi:glycosyltransferase involved in cell wall biosynthesis